jgi:hypothetical protein
MSRSYNICLAESGQAEWRAIAGFPGYDVSNTGLVRSWWKRGGKGNGIGGHHLSSQWKILSPAKNHHGGHLWVALYKDGERYSRFVHDLVLTAFVCERPDGMEGCHDPDPNPENNYISNLRWDTRQYNAEDAVRLHRTAYGERQHFAKLTERDIPLIIEMRQNGTVLEIIAQKFGVSLQTIHAVIVGRTWNRVSGLPKYQGTRRCHIT